MWHWFCTAYTYAVHPDLLVLASHCVCDTDSALCMRMQCILTSWCLHLIVYVHALHNITSIFYYHQRPPITHVLSLNPHKTRRSGCTAYTYTVQNQCHIHIEMQAPGAYAVQNQDSVNLLECWELSTKFQANLPCSTAYAYAVITCTDMECLCIENMMFCTEYMYAVLYWGETVFMYLVIHAPAQAEASVHAWLVCKVSVLMKLAILFSDMPMHMCCNNHMSHN